jgi:hypothetical protein
VSRRLCTWTKKLREISSDVFHGIIFWNVLVEKQQKIQEQPCLSWDLELSNKRKLRIRTYSRKVWEIKLQKPITDGLYQGPWDSEASFSGAETFIQLQEITGFDSLVLDNISHANTDWTSNCWYLFHTDKGKTKSCVLIFTDFFVTILRC